MSFHRKVNQVYVSYSPIIMIIKYQHIKTLKCNEFQALFNKVKCQGQLIFLTGHALFFLENATNAKEKKKIIHIN